MRITESELTVTSVARVLDVGKNNKEGSSDNAALCPRGIRRASHGSQLLVASRLS